MENLGSLIVLSGFEDCDNIPRKRQIIKESVVGRVDNPPDKESLLFWLDFHSLYASSVKRGRDGHRTT